MVTQTIFREYGGEEVTPGMLSAAAEFFSQHYGIWADNTGSRGKPGNPLTSTRLRKHSHI